MKKLYYFLAIFGLLILNTKPASASNPVSLILLSTPVPTATIDITVDMGVFTCPLLNCQTWYCDIYASPSGTKLNSSPGVYNGNQTYYFPGLTVPSGTTKIYCKWYYVAGNCGPFNDVWCAINYGGQASGIIDCNPCTQ